MAKLVILSGGFADAVAAESLLRNGARASDQTDVTPTEIHILSVARASGVRLVPVGRHLQQIAWIRRWRFDPQTGMAG